ncbi:hypothetical protein HG531_000128 [Fusarium graminearum]|nr:hypothetical protein HG531_000128 [Fusarium graminearum]
MTKRECMAEQFWLIDFVLHGIFLNTIEHCHVRIFKGTIDDLPKDVVTCPQSIPKSLFVNGSNISASPGLNQLQVLSRISDIGNGDVEEQGFVGLGVVRAGS